MQYDASNRKDIRRAEKAAARLEKDRIEFLRAALTTIQGRTFFHDLLSFCHIFNDPFSGDPLREAYSKGERNVGLRLYGDIVENCPDQFIQMTREAQIKEILDDRRNLDDNDSAAGESADSDASSEHT